MDTIILVAGNTHATIDQSGAWLTRVSDDRGDILYPKRNVLAPDGSIKVRGGCHVCIPNFGPGGDSGQPQHGYGRVTTWDVVRSNESSVELELESGSHGYEHMSSTLRYDLQEQYIDMTLTCTNHGDSDLRVAPGFHPYFMTARNEDTFTLNNEKLSKADVEGTLFIDEDRADTRLQVYNRAITISSAQLKLQAVWTDQLGEYICAEPTQAGYAFMAEAHDNQLLKPKQTKTFAARIKW